jgi:hypothetical protein
VPRAGELKGMLKASSCEPQILLRNRAKVPDDA